MEGDNRVVRTVDVDTPLEGIVDVENLKTEVAPRIHFVPQTLLFRLR